MALAYLTINLDAFTGDDHPPISQYSTITLDPGADHIDEDADVIHVRSVVVSLDQQGKAATANGVPCVDGKVPIVAGVMYAVSAPNVLRDGPHYIPALTAGQVVDLSDYITPGAPLTPDQAATLTARIVALEATPPGAGVTDHGALTGLSDDDHPIYLTTGRGDARYVQGSDSRLSDARTPTTHTHPASEVSDSTTTGRSLLTAADAAAARSAIGAGTSSLTIGTTSTTAQAGDWTPTWTDVTGKPSTFPPDTEATQDIIGAMVAGAGGTYNDAAGTITLPGGFDPVQFSIGYSGTAVPTLAASSFVTVTYGPATPSTNVGGGTFDTGTGIYTVPATGRYLILARVRAEGFMPLRSTGVGVHGSNGDGPFFVWRDTGGSARDVFSYQRIDTFTAGTQLRLFIYSDGYTYPLIAAALTIDRIG